MSSQWRDAKLRDVVVALEAGVSVNAADRPKSSDELGVLKVSAVTYGRFDPSAHKAVLPTEIERLNTIPKKDTIIVSRANTSELVGASAYVDQDYPDLFLSDKLWRLTVQAENSARWLSFVLASDVVRTEMSNRATGTSGSMKNISQDDFLSISVTLPPLAEQRKIAQILSTWDEAIALVEALIAALKRRKQGLMQRLLTGEVRFPGFVKSDEYVHTKFGKIPADWEYPTIGEIARSVSVKNSGGNELPVLSCTKYDGLVDSLEYFGRKIYSEDTSTYKVVARNQFAYATNHIEEGSIGYQNLYDEALISPMYTVFETGERVNDAYLYRLLKTELYRHIFEVSTSASVNRRGSLRWGDFSMIHVPLPALDEQRKIADMLQSADDVIAEYDDLAMTIREQKRGLMQRLLTGEVRVRVE